MLKILPLASRFHSSEQVQATLLRTRQRLQAHAIPHEVVASAPNLLFIITGGTEHHALEALQGQGGPALLLAHPDENSLPAAMEILSHLHQQGRRGRIILLNATEDGLEQLRNLAQHLRVAEAMQTRRLGRIGAPSDWLVGSRPEPALAQAAWGPEIVDIPLAALTAAMDEAEPKDIKALHEDFRTGASEVREPSESDLNLAARVAVGLQRVIREHRLDACTVRCFDLVVDRNTTGCLALSALLDEGVVAGCEGDLPAAMTMLWLQTMSGQPSFMANPQDLDPATNTLWLAHCTIARKMLRRYALRSHFESSRGVGIQGELEPGPYTLARIGGSELRELFVANGDLLRNGASELRCRTQVQLRLDEPVGQLLAKPLGNHHVLLSGHWVKQLKEYHELFVAPGKATPCPMTALDASSL